MPVGVSAKHNKTLDKKKQWIYPITEHYSIIGGDFTKPEKSKEKIIEQTIELIQESNGLIENITIRKIAEKSSVGLGLINHHFGTKEALIEECVQRIISGVIGAFRPNLGKAEDNIETTRRVAKQVMDFLMGNPEISKISILGDLKQPKERDNTTGAVHGFGSRLSGGDMQSSHKINSFMITAVMQVAFLRKNTLPQTLGVDFDNKTQRDAFIDDLIERFR